MSFFAGLYDAVMVPAEHTRLGRWRRAVVSPARGRVLEIGAGTGLGFRYYAAGARVVAVDPDVSMLRRARARARASRASILLVAADAEHLPFRDGRFDEAVVALAMCTIPHPARAVEEVARVLRRRGTLRMLEHVRVDRPAWVGALQHRLTPLWRRVAGGCHLDRRTEALVAAGGFVIERVKRHAGGVVREIVAQAPRHPSPARRAAGGGQSRRPSLFEG